MKKNRIGVVGLGYIGLPLALELGKHFKVIGYDIDSKRIRNLKKGIDNTNEISQKKILSSKKIFFSSNSENLKECNIYIIAVPTPIYKNKIPNLTFLNQSIKLISRYITTGNIIIFESTVYPGATEDYCVPLIEKYSKLKFNRDFFVGYCPERINPGDKKNNIENINKLVSGSNSKTTNKIKKLYETFIRAKVYKTSSIKVAEAAKILENTQRDINIAFMNEISIIFNKLNVDTSEVIQAASTKWNFLRFQPGLVGGHCISVDPYYLAHIAHKNREKPLLIKSARKINNTIPKYIVKNLENNLKNLSKPNSKIKILIMGITFKENCSDIRDSKPLEIVKLLNKKKYKTYIFDPWVNKKQLINLNLISKPKTNFYDAVIITVKHDVFKKMNINKIKKLGKKKSYLYDIKSIYNKSLSDFRL